MSLYVIVELELVPGQRAAFDAYEAAVMAILRRHGGELVAALALEDSEGETGHDELHVLQFPDRNRFEAFIADPDRAALANDRDAVIRSSRLKLATANPALMTDSSSS